MCWQNKLPKLENIKASRHYKQDNFGNVMKAEVHYASKGYSLLSYDRKVYNKFNQGCISSEIGINSSNLVNKYVKPNKKGTGYRRL